MAGLRKLKKLGTLLLGLSLLSSAGGYFFAIQSIAWAGMLWYNAHHDSALVAMQKTFDGKHPCGRCHEIGSEQAKQTKVPAQDLERRFDPANLNQQCFTARSWEISSLKWSYALESLTTRQTAPPLPPPRTFFPLA